MLKTIRTILPISYTLNGDNRYASVSVAADTSISFKSLQSDSGEDDFKFYGEQAEQFNGILHADKARLIPSGGNVLLPPKGKIAAEITLSVGSKEFTFAFSEFGVWEQKGFTISDSGSSELATNIKSGSVVRIDDYNIQNKFIGGQVSFILEICEER